MRLSASSRMFLAPDLEICRLPIGMWQVSGAHGRIDRERALAAMREQVDAGFTTFDLADHYGPAEDLVGQFRERCIAEPGGGTPLGGIQAFTKWVPQPGPMTRKTVENAIELSLRRMGTPRLDLLQFHWWDYGDPRYLDALRHLADLRDVGTIRHLALTNFDTEHLHLILRRGIPILSNQVQYSLVDQRPDIAMRDLCLKEGVHLLTYGTVAGGLLSDRYLGRPEPARCELTTASLQKYMRMIDVWGGWDLFQDLLAALRAIADKHRSTIASVAVRTILDRPAVAGVIVGVRLGETEHIADNVRLFDLPLDADDHDRITSVTSRSANLFHAIGDCGDEYRG